MTFLYTLSVVLKVYFVITVAAAVQTGLTSYVAEVFVVFDPFAVKNYEDNGTSANAILHDAEFFLTHVNEVYKTMRQYGLDLQIRIARMEIATEGILFDPNSNPGVVSAPKLIREFVNWQISRHATNPIDYDIGILYTGLKFADKLGVAYKGTICRDKSKFFASALIHFGSFDTALITAHELAHSFGADHDGKASYKVMRENKNSDHPERFAFSRCTAVDILQNLKAKGDQCLRQTTARWQPAVTVDNYQGQLRDMQYVCRLEFGKDAFVCPYNKEEDKKCLRFYCRINSNSKCHQVQITEGMACDEDKICRQGECVPDTSGYAKDSIAGCMYGDERAVIFRGKRMTCAESYDFLGGVLCVEVFPQECCATCDIQERKSQIPGCFGDSPNMLMSSGERINCTTAIARKGARYVCNNKYYARRCCKICNDIKGGPDCPYEAKGITWNKGGFTRCADLQTLDCQRKTVAKKCCQRCAQSETEEIKSSIETGR